MRRFRLFAVVALLGSALSAQAGASIILNAGESVTLNFNAMHPVGIGPGNVAEVRLTFGGDLLDVGEQLRIYAFEDLDAAGVPFFTTVPDIGGTGKAIAGFAEFSEHWADFTGSIIIAQLTGSTTLDVVTADRYSELHYQSDNLAVPTPATLPLFATGLGMMGWFAWHKKRRIKVGGQA